MVRMTHWMGMLLLVCSSTGCAQQLFDYVDATCYQIKCEHRAKTAWMDVRDLYGGVAFPYNFGEGFRDGYTAVCLGNDSGCAPPMPPRRYWSSCYLNCEGKARAMAWYDGYAHGVVAASCGGCANSCQIATSAGGAGSGELGTALKGYKPPVQNPYMNQFGQEGMGHDGDGLPGYGQDPTPLDRPLIPPHIPGPGNDLQEDPFSEESIPDHGGDLAPEAPAVLRSRELPHLPAAEIYRVPVF